MQEKFNPNHLVPAVGYCCLRKS